MGTEPQSLKFVTKEMYYKDTFKLKYFDIVQSNDVFKIGTDAMVLGAWLSLNFNPKTILDIGTGTGILSLMMAQKFPDARITAFDANPEAVLLSRNNFKSSSLGLNIESHLSDFKIFKSQIKFDVIISNPPYFVNSMKAKNQVDFSAKHLDMDDLRALFGCIKNNLSEYGIAAIIHPFDEKFQLMATEFGLFLVKQLQVYGTVGKLVRQCSCFTFQNQKTEITELVLRDEKGAYTQEYRQITEEFHGIPLK